ncbi:Gldg family protein [Candidatus Nitronereus thalassa]|uniref:Gldg family protein n=1 Tax=Candidatus Nitronereus thalassa TaxID=3020898 RepID=A0ABU3K986_9BACT|nr:Gldg family protein [Candidatus Nitronereus thalassa]MDT7042948.1 Gldg family protein [Candidatus Nitronereus thalassa]
MNARLLTGSGLLIAVVLFFAVNVLSNVALRSVRFDLTDQKLYTLSEGTKNILQSLEEPITLRFYLSKKLATGLPGINSYANRVMELLQEYEAAAGGNLNLHIIDPEPFSEEEDRAVGYGLQGVPLNNGNVQFYFGLIGTSSTDDQELIPFFQPDREEFLEYDLTKLVYQLSNPKPKVVGLLSTLPIEGGRPPMGMMPGQGGSAPWMILDTIREIMQVKSLDKEVKNIPEDIEILMVVHPKRLSDPTLYAIDQFVLRGGRALVFVDPHSEADRVPPNPRNPMGMQGPRNSDLGKVFEAWGIELVKGKVVGDLPLAKKVNFQKESRTFVADYPLWIDLTPKHLNAEDVVTAKLPNLTFASAGILQKKEGSEINFIPLVETDDQAMQIDSSRLMFMPDVEGLLQTYRPEGKKLTMAARLTGKVKTAFPEGRPKAKETDNKDEEIDSEDPAATDQPHLSESADPINVIVVADTDMLQDRFWVQVQNFLGQRIGIPTSANNSFVTNALDNLTGSSDLITVRSRGSFSRPFTLVRAIQQEAEMQYRQKEQALQQRLKDTERKIQELQKKKEDQTTIILSGEQQAALDGFRQQLVSTRKELRGVQHELQKNIETLEGIVKFLNIGLMPMIIIVGGVVFSAYKVRRRGKTKV